jgi:uracil-DNA glycosylase family 4
MSSESISEQLLSLTEQAQEHTAYLQELGVETFEGIAGERPESISQVDSPPAQVAHRTIAQASEKPAQELKPADSQPLPAATKPIVVPPAANTLFGNIFQAPDERLPESSETFEQIWTAVGNCTRCPLSEGRTNIVHTEGNRKARLMFVGEAPGADEDAQARPFVGRAGQLLTKIIEAIGFKREEVLIGNINRCRPPGNRAPTPEEVLMCKPFLLREIASARPDVIVVMGNTAMKNLLDIKEGITRVRGQFQNYKGVKVMPTFHPAYLLRDPSKKRETWEDLKKVRDYLDSTPRKEA